jgi:hypothetical protein
MQLSHRAVTATAIEIDCRHFSSSTVALAFAPESVK